MRWRLAGAGVGLAVVAGCAMQLGAPKPLHYPTVALQAPAGASAAEVAQTIQQAGGQIVMIASPTDSAWFADVARRTGLVLSGPGRADSLGLAFLAAKPVGDTTLTLKVEAGAPITLHDALYQPAKDRYFDLLFARIDSTGSARAVVRSLLGYIATDVMQNSALILGLSSPDTARVDSIASLVRPAFVDVKECLAGADSSAVPPASSVRLLIGPMTQMRCESARRLAGPGSPLYAQLVMGRVETP